MAGTTEDFQATVKALNQLAAEYKSEYSAVLDLAKAIDDAQDTLNSSASELTNVASKLSSLPTYGERMAALVQRYRELADQTKLRVTNADFSGDCPKFEGEGITLELSSSAPSAKSVEIALRLDGDTRIQSIQVMENVLGERTDVSSEFSEEISAALELQNFGYFVRHLKARIGA